MHDFGKICLVIVRLTDTINNQALGSKNSFFFKIAKALNKIRGPIDRNVA